MVRRVTGGMDEYDKFVLNLADEPRGLAPAPVAEPDWDDYGPVTPFIKEAWQTWWLPKQQALRAKETER